ncbi:hypothetical protein IMSAG049_00310 [Clostridiales bacterium]|nr:hypothetical protein IMSAG049_00310 [Clostridiales bacterium]
MKTVIIYYSEHHGNTKKLLDTLTEFDDIELIKAEKGIQIDLSNYDIIGFASGIYFSRFNDAILQCAEELLPENKDVFVICTYGVKRSVYSKDIKKIIEQKSCRLLGSFGCRGYDTFGILGKIGGIAKERPNDKDMAEVKIFFKNLVEKVSKKEYTK